MKFIQSFWSKPFFDSIHKDNWNFRYNGGFPTPFLFYCSWMYSCLSIKKYYSNLHLITDDRGIEIFKYALDLPYVSFSNSLNDLESYDKRLWALGKLYAYMQQKESFCHIDGDVFIFGSVLNPLHNSQIFCQSFDYKVEQYEEIHLYIHRNFDNVPPEFQSNLSQKMKFINAGVIGGSNLSLFQLYTSKAFELIDNNLDKLDNINSGMFNLYYEQFLFSNIIANKNLEIVSLYSKPDNKNEHNFAAFHHIPKQSQYVHLISYLKKSTEFMEQIVARLQLEFPKYYSRLTHFYNSNENT